MPVYTRLTIRENTRIVKEGKASFQTLLSCLGAGSLASS